MIDDWKENHRGFQAHKKKKPQQQQQQQQQRVTITQKDWDKSVGWPLARGLLRFW